MGYYRAGFEVVGVDINPQPRFPFEFRQADALTYPLEGFDAIHASPPCQAYSCVSKCRPGLQDSYPRLIEVVRRLFQATEKTWVIENVPGAPLLNPIVLCGEALGLPLYRHRLFESNAPLTAPGHLKHPVPCARAGHWKPGYRVSVAGNCAPIAMAREAMGIDWMTRRELAESIPPAFTEWIGKQLIAHLQPKAAGGA